MFVRIMRAGVDVRTAGAVRRYTEAYGRPLCQQLPGFQSWLLGSDTQEGRLVWITLWETAAQAEAVQVALAGVAREVETLGVILGHPEIYEVAPGSSMPAA